MRVKIVQHLALGCLLALTTVAAACTDRTSPTDLGPLPVAPTAYPTGPASSGSGVAQVSEDIQAVTVRIDNGKFDADVYDIQSRPARLEVWAYGGPYTLVIDGLTQPQQLDPNGETVIGLTAPA
ncbi:MAG: hypothetical protein AB7P40_15125, partial [Chloroflexota bacterium]